jgi:hypothetical protein
MSSEEMPPPADKPMTKEEKVQLERQEEQKLRAKYPNRNMIPGGGPGGVTGGPGGVASGAGGGGHSAFLQKRLAKGQKYFDSGDYQMAKQKPRGAGGIPGRLAMPVLAQPPTGETIPTPELVSIVYRLFDLFLRRSLNLSSSLNNEL